MGPDEILIDGLKKIYNHNHKRTDPFADCAMRQWAGEALEAYKKENIKKNNTLAFFYSIFLLGGGLFFHNTELLVMGIIGLILLLSVWIVDHQRKDKP